jgi:hypothetical protein
MLGGVEVTGKAREHAKEMLRTHLELPADPTPTDRMPALKVKGVLAQAKVAAQEGKDPAAEPKSLGVDPRATAGGARTAADQKGSGGESRTAGDQKGSGGESRAAGRGADPRVAAGGSLRGAAGASSGEEAKGADGKATAAAKADGRGAADTKVSGAGDSKPATKGGKDNDKIIDLNAAKAAGRPASKRR